VVAADPLLALLAHDRGSAIIDSEPRPLRRVEDPRAGEAASDYRGAHRRLTSAARTLGRRCHFTSHLSGTFPGLRARDGVRPVPYAHTGDREDVGSSRPYKNTLVPARLPEACEKSSLETDYRAPANSST